MMRRSIEDRNINLDFIPPKVKKVLAPIKKPLMHMTGVDGLFNVYDSITRRDNPLEFCQNGLEILNIEVEALGRGLRDMPLDKPLVIVSNHPFGGIEGLALMAEILPLRPECKFLANFMLGIMPELRPCMIEVNPFETKEARRANVRGLRNAITHVAAGGSLVVFPAGEVSHLQPKMGGIVDPVWSKNVARIIRKTNADVLPLYFHGRNSLFFNMMGMVHPFARTAMLPKQLYNKRNKKITYSVGNIIPSNMLKTFATEEDVMNYLRVRSYSLAKRPSSKKFRLPFRKEKDQMEIAAARPHESLLRELSKLPKEQILAKENGFTVFEAQAFQIPNMLHDLGRLRELTFRPVGEGTGLDLDLDTYDYEYDHLILWDDEKETIAGAYRLGCTDNIFPRSGIKGMYCSTLFKFKPEFFTRFEHAVELGRAIVNPDYQKDYSPLMLLWKGIGQYILRRPGTRYLFGPCSLPLEFNPFTLVTAVNYLKEHHIDKELSTLVAGKKAPKLKLPKGIPSAFNIADLSFTGLNGLVRDMEDGRTMPILFKHYLRLAGKIGAFHVDNAFGSLDAFLMIDLSETPLRMLKRYLGDTEAVQLIESFKEADK
ncbi:MAG: lysophospholipid acyltransferase family protein [Halodesulfovibrio sp.]|uniref:lysophospholipid acyltransferase family protein n=1 Tax=Halodesulfovibrio sp. TaxID=1912772 RepID=UPI00359E39F7